MIRIMQLKLRPDHTQNDLRKAIMKKLHLKEGSDFFYEIQRQSVDARKKPDVFYVYTVDVQCSQEKQILKRMKNDSSVSSVIHEPYRFPGTAKADSAVEAVQLNERPVIVGSGPAGLFCALMLARHGYAPILIERGENVESRTESVKAFWNGHPLNPESNVQFGEGGAGTFSDGKLNSMIKDPAGRIRYVLETFTAHGAGEEILYSYKPHIGTEVLSKVVKSIREEIIAQGGTVLFRHKLVEISKNSDGSYELTILKDANMDSRQLLHWKTQVLVLALGHSARDTFRMLSDHKMDMHAKAFAVGVRVQHPQVLIDDAMYGTDCPYEMGAAPYKVTANMEIGNAYSFCMCPGGYVVNASSEDGRTAVNGMSYHDRASGNANSAIVVSVAPEEYLPFVSDRAEDLPEALRGIAFQRMLEEKSYQAGQGKVPAQRYEDYVENVPSKEAGIVAPCVKGEVSYTNLRPIFPERINQCIIQGMQQFDRRIKGFADPDTLLYAVESRTSSPIRLERNDQCVSTSHSGIYPCGEGAGYAGGITSAAVDGIRVAEQIVLAYKA